MRFKNYLFLGFLVIAFGCNPPAENTINDEPALSDDTLEIIPEITTFTFSFIDFKDDPTATEIKSLKSIEELMKADWSQIGGTLLNNNFENDQLDNLIENIDIFMDSLLLSNSYTKSDLRKGIIKINCGDESFLAGKWVDKDKYIFRTAGVTISYHVLNESVYACCFIDPWESPRNDYELECIYELDDALRCKKALKYSNAKNDEVVLETYFENTSETFDNYGFVYKYLGTKQLQSLSKSEVGELFNSENLNSLFSPIDSISQTRMGETPFEEFRFWTNRSLNDRWHTNQEKDSARAAYALEQQEL
jgi:hypothetical protein